MQTHRRAILDAFATLLNYPGRDYALAASKLVEELALKHSGALEELLPFHRFVVGSELHELEESFTRTFEINPQCSLEIGWHLFGEEYLRGLFLVRMREVLRRHRIVESTELPDHITHVLAVLAVMPRDAGAVFAAACVLPALDKMLQSFNGRRNDYEHLLRCLRFVLCSEFNLPETLPGENEDEEIDLNADPLWRHPVRGIPETGPVQLVPLEVQLEAPWRLDGGAVTGGKPS